MNDPAFHRNGMRHPIKRALQMWVRRRFWRMNVDPTASIAATAYVDRTWPKGVHIGAGAIIDEEAVILTHDMTRGIYRDTHIGSDCYVGPRAIILPGIRLGANARVAAGAVVTRDVPENVEVAGNPAKARE